MTILFFFTSSKMGSDDLNQVFWLWQKWKGENQILLICGINSHQMQTQGGGPLSLENEFTGTKAGAFYALEQCKKIA